MIKSKATIFPLLLLLVCAPMRSPAAEIQIDLAQPHRSSLKQGFLNGSNSYSSRNAVSNEADSLLSALKPTSWRFSGIRGYGYGADIYQFIVADYRYDARFGTSTVLNLQDIFNAKVGRPVAIKSTCAQEGKDGCFISFASLRQAWHAILSKFLIETNDAKIAFFDLLAEPDLTFKNVSHMELYQLAKDAYTLVKQYRPDARTVGPSFVSFKPSLLSGLIQNMVRDGIRFDAISWHELGKDPGVIGEHVAAMRSIFQQNPAICRPSCPEIHINEYHGEDTMLVPGHAVAWLGHLEAANVDQANKACWGGDPGSPIPYQSCWYGVSGLMLPDRAVPQPLYWVYKFYADMNGSRFAVKSTLPKITAIAGELGGGRIGILVGNYGKTQTEARVHLVNFKNPSVRVDVTRIPNTANRVTSMPRADTMTSFDAVPTSSVLSLQFDRFPEGDAYWVVVTPK